MSVQKSIYSFFKKVPSPAVVRDKTNESNQVSEDFKTPQKNGKNKSIDYEKCDVVWAKIDGYPWWPSLICDDPKKKTHVKGNNVHVQFFDDPPTRAWVNRKRCVEKYNPDSDKKNPKNCSDLDLQKLGKACEEADKAFKQSVSERNSLLFNFNDTSESEDGTEKEETSPGTDKENDDGTKDPPAKRRRLYDFNGDDSEDEYKPAENEESDDEEDGSSGVDSNEEDINTDVDEEEETPKKGVKRKRNQSTRSNRKVYKPNMTPISTSTKKPSYSGTVSETTKARLSLFKSIPNASTPSNAEAEGDDWPHLKYEFLMPHKIMDKNKRRPDDPDYDPKTLFVPEDFKSKQTPGLRQWWEVKSDYFDCVLFFKIGKFYELYHMDAVIGMNVLALTPMRGGEKQGETNKAHSGFPEVAYGRYSTILVQKGYKVARIEQTETPDMMDKRCKLTGKNTKWDKVVAREVCQITTKGTQVFSFIDGDAKESETNYLLAITEKESAYGVCFIDTSIGVFHLGQFTDDKYLSRLRTLLSHYPPVQIIYEKNHLSPKTLHLFKTSLASVVQEALTSESEFWTAGKTLRTLLEEDYFSEKDKSEASWPEAIKSFLSQADALGLTASNDGELALKSLGACMWYLKRAFLDQQILAMKQFEVYTPVELATEIPSSEDSSAPVNLGRYMVLDGISLTNLEVLVNSNGGKIGTLLEKLDRCCTFSGKRLLRQWLCSPLCSIPAIESRQKAIAELLEKSHVVEEVRSILKQVPDLERLLGKIHTLGNAVRSKTHPDSRAFFFEDQRYSIKKIQDFLAALKGFEKLQEAMAAFRRDFSPASDLLKQCSLLRPEGKFPDLEDVLKFFDEAFDHELAKKEGNIYPKSSGVDLEYDAVLEELKCIEKDSAQYLKTVVQHFGVNVKYFGSEKNRFQLEIPENRAQRTTSEYEFTSSRKGFKRYVTPKTKEFLRRQMSAEETKSNVLKDLSRRIFAQFSSTYDNWNAAVQCMSLLDVLMSLAEYCRTEEGEMCFPEFFPPKSDSEPFVDVRSGRHPCIAVADGFIPNDTRLGTDEYGNLILLTGPNMGGKSTLMRQLGLIIIMAHMGCQVPSSSCRLVPVDRIFTRIGANDDILAGESTFYVELSETSLILNHATKYSLVLVDELGRGTSTYDGTAIAYAVVNELAERRCRTLFSTHYHTLVEDFKNSNLVSLGHMACMVETDEDDPSEETVTFLYKFASGDCPKSHGFNAAKLAGVPSHIVKVGREKARLLENEGERRKIFRKLWNLDSSAADLPNLINSLKLISS